MNVRFTMLARLQLMPILRDIRGRREDDSRKLARRILGKIKVLNPELKRLQHVLPDGKVVADPDVLDACADIYPDITVDQADKLISVINAHPSWGPDDDDWLDPLIEQLQLAKNPTATVTEAATATATETKTAIEEATVR